MTASMIGALGRDRRLALRRILGRHPGSRSCSRARDRRGRPLMSLYILVTTSFDCTPSGSVARTLMVGQAVAPPFDGLVPAPERPWPPVTVARSHRNQSGYRTESTADKQVTALPSGSRATMETVLLAVAEVIERRARTWLPAASWRMRCEVTPSALGAAILVDHQLHRRQPAPASRHGWRRAADLPGISPSPGSAMRRTSWRSGPHDRAICTGQPVGGPRNRRSDLGGGSTENPLPEWCAA